MKLEQELLGYRNLFLDRDGTINSRVEGSYVMNYSQFHFLEGALEAMYLFADKFEKIFIVTNQQGIGKELMSHEDLSTIHNNMMEDIDGARGRVDQIYYCPHLAVFDPVCRKPNPGMALQAQIEFPDIIFEESIMIGDSDSDIAFGNMLEMFTVRIIDPTQLEKNEKADLEVNSLKEFSLLL